MNDDTPQDLNEKTPKDRKTFRVGGVPLDWNPEQLKTFLSHHKSSIPNIWSFAREVHDSSKTATVVFQDIPFSPRTDEHWQILLPKPSNNPITRDQYLTLDNGFLGITTLYTPPPEDHKVE